MSKNYPFVMKLILCILILTSIFIFRINAGTTHNGIADLRNHQLLREKVIDMSGEWQFYYGKHLSANEMKSLKPADKHFIKVPSNWKNTVINGHQLSTLGIGTYYLQIITDKADKKSLEYLGLRFGNITSAYKLWVNNQLVGQAGKATQSREDFKPMYAPKSFYFYTNSDTIDVILQVSNFYDPNYAGISQKILAGERNIIEDYTLQSNAIAIFILSIFFLLFFYQLILSFVHREEHSHRVIALLSVIIFSKMLLDGDLVIFHFFPDLNFTFCYRIWLLSFMTIPLVIRLTKLSFPSEVNRSVEKGIYLFYLMIAIAFLSVDIRLLMNHIFFVIYATIVCVGYLFFVLIKAILKNRHYSIIHTISFSVMILTILNDLIYVTNQITPGYLSHIGVCFYMGTQSIIISLKFAHSHKRAIKLTHELEQINLNLENIVEARTRELNEANIELGKFNKQKDFLISTISHDLMSSFNVLITFTKSLSKDTSLSEKHQNTMSMLHRASERGYMILDNILTWTKLQIAYKPDIKPITRLSTVIKENITLASEEMDNKSINAIIDVNDSLHFKCDKSHLNTILRNLLSNAIKFSQTGKEITFSNLRKEGFVQIIIHDEGIGMPCEIVHSIFDSEKNKKREGTNGERGSGLGLLIVKELVENNHGTIFCFSQPGIGSDFILEFPLLNGEPDTRPERL